MELRYELKQKPVEDLQIYKKSADVASVVCYFPFSIVTLVLLLSVINQTFIFFFFMKQAPQHLMLHSVYVKMFVVEFAEPWKSIYIIFLFSINRIVLLFNSKWLKNWGKSI